MSTDILYQKGNDDYATPVWILKGIFEWWFDPCPLKGRTKLDELNGLRVDWQPHTFVNPPYSDPSPWIDKAIKEFRKGNTVVLLLKHDTTTRWYDRLHEAGAYFLPIGERLKFSSGKEAPFASILAVLCPLPEEKKEPTNSNQQQLLLNAPNI